MAKHLLLSVLVIVLAAMLLNFSILQVTQAIPVLVVLALVGAAIGGGLVGYFIHDFVAKQQEPGITLDAYTLTVFDTWQARVNDAANYLKSISQTLLWSKEFYSRVAAYAAGGYLESSSLDPYEEQIMRPIAQDLYAYYENAVINSLKSFTNELVYFTKSRLTGDLASYDIYMGPYPGASGGINLGSRWLKSLSSSETIKPVYRFYYANTELVAWVLGDIIIATMDIDGDEDPDGSGYLYLSGLYNNVNYTFYADSAQWRTYSVTPGIYKITASGAMLLAMDNILITFQNKELMIGFAAKFYTVRFDQTFSLYKQNTKLAEMNLDNVWNAIKSIHNSIDMIYDAAFNSARVQHTTCRLAGVTDSSRMNECVLPPPTVVMPTTNEMYQRFGTNYDLWLAYYLAYLNSLNETLARANRITTVTPQNVSFADVREQFINVVLRDATNATVAMLQKLVPLWITQAQEFRAGANNTLQSRMGAIAVFPNGTIKYLEIPAGWTITPSRIVTPEGDVPTLMLDNYEAGIRPAYQENELPETEFTSNEQAVQTMLQLFIMLLPLIVILALVQVIANIGRR